MNPGINIPYMQTWVKFQNVYVNSFGEVRTKTGKLLRPYVHASRNIFYLRVTISGKKYLVHKLNWMAHNNTFEVPDGYQVDHNDGNAFNNNISNLVLRRACDNQNKKRRPTKSVINKMI